MKFAQVQQSIEEYIQAQWTVTQVAFDNAGFNSDLYDQYLRCNVLFGEGRKRTVTVGCYRQIGVLMLTVFVKPAVGRARLLDLANIAATLVTDVRVGASLPLVAPVVNLKVPDLILDNTERSGWVQANVSSPFYYDWST